MVACSRVVLISPTLKVRGDCTDAAQGFADETLQRPVLETSQELSHSQSQDRRKTASLLRDAPLVDQDTTRGGLVDPEHAEALMALALNATGLAAFARAHPFAVGRAGDLVVLGARADAELSSVAAMGPGTRHGGGVFIMDVLRVVLEGVSRAVPTERADAVRWRGLRPSRRG